MTETTFTVDIKFLSDWHIGGGSGRHGAVDRSIVTDRDGLPLVPAKTAVGILRDAAEIAAGALDAGQTPKLWRPWVEALFGSQPTDGHDASASPRPAALVPTPLRLPEAERAYFATARTEGPGLTRADLVRATKITRPGVKLDPDTGTAMADFFRTEERARAGLLVTGRWLIVHPDGADITPAVVLMYAAAKLARTVGGKRRRGAGEAEFTLSGLPEWAEVKHTLAIDPPPPWQQFSDRIAEPARSISPGALRHTHDLEITVQLPVIADAGLWGNVVRTASFISGAALLPIIGAGLSEPGPADLIRAGALVVTDATPDINGTRGLPWPRALTQSKDAPSSDAGYLNVTAPHRENPRLKAPQGRFLSAHAPNWRAIDTVQNMHATIDDGRQRPTSATGGVFVYQGIAQGTVLRASIYLPDGIKLDADRITGTHRIGRSRKDDYGLVDVQLVRPVEGLRQRQAIAAGQPFRLWLTSDLLLRNSRGGTATDPNSVAAALSEALGIPGAVTVCHTSSEHLHGQRYAEVADTAVSAVTRRQTWQRSWGLPRPSLVGIAAGSVYKLVSAREASAAAIAVVETGGLGDRTAEGFGRVLIDPPVLQHAAVDVPKTEDAPRADEATIEPVPNPQVTTAAWRAVIARTAATRAADTYKKFISAKATRAQLGNLRGVIDVLPYPHGRGAAQSWVNRAGGERSTWGGAQFDKLKALLLHDPQEPDHPIWRQLFGDSEVAPSLARDELAVFAVQVLLTDVLRHASEEVMS